MKLTYEEAAAILAGLRMVQREIGFGWRGTNPYSGIIHDIYTNDGEFDGLTADEIDRLCERINVSE